MNIIVVDDELSALRIVFEDIVNAGQEVHYQFFYDDEEAITSYVCRHEVDAAFLDIKMPRINGLDLAQKLLEIKPSLKFVFITGLTLSNDDLPSALKAATIGFLYKPYDHDKMLAILERLRGRKRKLIAKTFESFDCFVDGRKIAFPSYKSKELLALLLVYRDSTLLMGDAIAHLWPEYEIEKAKILYRDAVWKLRRVLQEHSLECVSFKRGALSLDPELVDCDYYRYLDTGKGDYHGEFLKNYDWSIDYLPTLDNISLKGR